MINKSFRFEREWIRIVFLIVMNCPPIRHHDGILGKEVTIVPIVLDKIMIISKFVDGSPSQNFLKNQLRDHEMKTLIMARMYGKFVSSSKFGVRSPPTTRSNSS